ncbi:putative membrane protein [Klebsiella phage Muenster]|nr:putative membrane protein [Klebsiella phage Muenster]
MKVFRDSGLRLSLIHAYWIASFCESLYYIFSVLSTFRCYVLFSTESVQRHLVFVCLTG